MNGRFKIIRTGKKEFKVEIIEQNEYAKIAFNTTEIISLEEESRIKFIIKSFTITDKNGFKYYFDKYKTLDFETYGIYPIHYYMSKVEDKYDVTLLEYEYVHFNDAYLGPPPFYIDFASKDLDIKQININKIGKLNVERPAAQGYIHSLTLKNNNDEILKKVEGKYYDTAITIDSNNSWVKRLLNKLNIYGKDLSNKQVYTFEYNHKALPSGMKLNDYGFLIKKDECNNISHAFKNYLHYDYCVLNKIKLPTGGTTFYEFEPNDFTTYNENSPISESHHFQFYKENNSENFDFQDIPLVHDPLNHRYLVDPYLIPNADHTKIFINYSGEPYELNLLGNIHYKNPSLLVYAFLKTANFNTAVGTKVATLNTANSVCTQGKLINFYNNKFSLEYDQNKLQYYNSITAKLIVYKNNEDLKKRVFGMGLRIKKITTFDQDLNLTLYKSGGHNLVPSKEIILKYNKFNEPNSTSGTSKFTINYFNPSINSGFRNYSDLIYYSNVTEKITGLGTTEYTYNTIGTNLSDGLKYLPNNSNIKKMPIKIVKKDESNNVIEENIISRSFKEFNSEESDAESQPILVYEKIINRNYINGNSTPLELITESRFDTISRNLTSKKIINSLLNETFEEQYTYVKHNDSYLPKTVNKFKNGIALNRSQNFYTSIYCAQNNTINSYYNLSNTKIAKANLPLEIENEYTKYSCGGKLLEYKTKDGVYVSQIWGYNGAFVIAELHNIRYTEINEQILSNLITAANKTDLTYNENTIRSLVDQLRSTHPNAKIKSYTFNPLVGITSMTDVNGRNEFYEYDNFNRLYRIKDHNSLILKEYNYNYINQ